MKKYISVFPAILIIIILLFNSCVTNNVTYEDAEKGLEPISPLLSFPFMFVPGLSQLLHGEFIEAAVVAGATYGGIGAALLIGRDEEALAENRFTVPQILSMSAFAGGMLWNMADVYVTGFGRAAQYGERKTEAAINRAIEDFKTGNYEQSYDKVVEISVEKDILRTAYRAAAEGACGLAVDTYSSLGPMAAEMNREQLAADPFLKGWYSERIKVSVDLNILYVTDADVDLLVFALLAAEYGDTDTIVKVADLNDRDISDEKLLHRCSVILDQNGYRDRIIDLYRSLDREVPTRYLNRDEIYAHAVNPYRLKPAERAEWLLQNDTPENAYEGIRKLLSEAETAEDWMNSARINMVLTASLLASNDDGTVNSAAETLNSSSADTGSRKAETWQKIKDLSEDPNTLPVTASLLYGRAAGNLSGHQIAALADELDIYDYFFGIQ